MPSLTPPPTGPTLDWRVFRDWLYKLWKAVTGLTFGADTTTYSAAVFTTGQDTSGGAIYNVPGYITKIIASNNSGQSIPTTTLTGVTGFTTVLDQNGEFNAATGVFTVKVAGQFFCSAGFQFAAAVWAAGETAQVYIGKNGVSQIKSAAYAWGATNLAMDTTCVAGLVNAAAGDTINAQVFQNSGGALALITGITESNFLTITRVA